MHVSAASVVLLISSAVAVTGLTIPAASLKDMMSVFEKRGNSLGWINTFSPGSSSDHIPENTCNNKYRDEGKYLAVGLCQDWSGGDSALSIGKVHRS